MDHEAIKQEKKLRVPSRSQEGTREKESSYLFNLHRKGFTHHMAKDTCMDTETSIS